MKFDCGDTIVFSSRTIPGNEDSVHPHPEPARRARHRHRNRTPDGPIHASGHPTQGRTDAPLPPRAPHLRRADAWRTPPPRDARRLRGGARHWCRAGRARRPAFSIGPDEPHSSTKRAGGPALSRWLPCLEGGRPAVVQRKRLAWNGHVAASVVIHRNGDFAAEPEIEVTGIPSTTPTATWASAH